MPSATTLDTAHETAPPHRLLVTDPDALDAIGRPGVNLVVWTREPPTALAASLASRRAEDIPRGRLEAPAAALRPAAAALVGDALADDPRARRALVDDIVRLGALFARITARRALRLRLDRVADGGCRRFHHDAVGLRLLCTYRGAGTEWVPNHAVRREAIGTGAGNDEISPDRSARRRLRAFDVGLLKGEAFPGNRGNGIVHRSPPVAPGDPARLLLCIDEGEE